MTRFLTFLIFSLGGIALAADKFTDISWEDLLPGESTSLIPNHGNEERPTDPAFATSTSYSAGVVKEFDGKNIRIPGFVVPLDVSGDDVKSLLLVPYFGACIHLPPPPPNQVVYIEFEKAVTIESIWEPVWISGKLSTTAYSSAVGDAAYSLAGSTVEAYEY